jgi:ubiquinone/menaquinone biosynthesis C-methylase UbiE
MVQVARERSGGYPSVDFRVADAMTWGFPVEVFNCVACIATLHHLPIVEMLSKMRDALKVGGTLVVLDLFQGEGLSDVFTSALAVPVDAALRLVKTGRLRESRQVRGVWAEHRRHDSYPTLSRMRQVCASLLPGAEVRRHLLWRYSIVWRKTALSSWNGGGRGENWDRVPTASASGRR